MPEMTYAESTLLQAQNKRIAELEEKISLLEVELKEQARLLGMGGEREATLLATISRLETENSLLKLMEANLRMEKR